MRSMYKRRVEQPGPDFPRSELHWLERRVEQQHTGHVLHRSDATNDAMDSALLQRWTANFVFRNVKERKAMHEISNAQALASDRLASILCS